MKQKKINSLKYLFAFGIALFFLSMQGLLGQDRWNKVSNPNKSSTSLDIFGEAYYKMPINFLGINAKSLKQEIRLPNEKGEEEIFILTPTPLLSKSLSAKYPKNL